eukprot:969270_1
MADIRSGPPQWIFMAVILGLLVAGGIVFTIQSSSNKKETEQLREKLRTLGAQLDSPNAAQKLHETVQTLTAQLNRKDELVTHLRANVQTLEAQLEQKAGVVPNVSENVQTLEAQLKLQHAEVVEKLRKRNRELVVLLDPFVEFSQGGNGTLSTRISPPFLEKLEGIAKLTEVTCDVVFYDSGDSQRMVKYLPLKGDLDGDSCMKFSVSEIHD